MKKKHALLCKGGYQIMVQIPIDLDFLLLHTLQKLIANDCGVSWLIQLNEYETDSYFFQFFQSNTIVCLIIYVFFKSCEPKPEQFQVQIQVHKSQIA